MTCDECITYKIDEAINSVKLKPNEAFERKWNKQPKFAKGLKFKEIK